MTRSVGARLPPQIAGLLDGPSEVRDQALVLATVDSGGAPRFALLSFSECVVVDGDHLLLALWPHSASAANLERSDAASLLMLVEGAVCTVVLHRESTIPFELDEDSPMRAFECSVVEVREDRVGYASVVGALTFELEDPDAVLPRWRRLGSHLSEIARAGTARRVRRGVIDG